MSDETPRKMTAQQLVDRIEVEKLRTEVNALTILLTGLATLLIEKGLVTKQEIADETTHETIETGGAARMEVSIARTTSALATIMGMIVLEPPGNEDA